MKKTCPKCSIEKTELDFYKCKSKSDGLQSWCKSCESKRNRDSKRHRKYADKKKKENPYWKVQRAHKKFATKNGMDFESLEKWYEKQWMKQQAQCAICGKVFSDDDCIDHCHKTNKLRGLLCICCNTGIGMLKDSSELCLKASEYLTN